MKKIILYITVFAGCFFEGETTLIASSFAAHRGYLEIFFVVLLAFTATQSWDWLWFMIGRIKGRAVLAKRPKLKQKADRIDVLLLKYPVAVLLGYRFLYGFRTAVPLVIGMSSISKRKFLIYSALNTMIWDCLFSSHGFFFGAFLKANWKSIEHFKLEIMGGLILAGVLLGLFIRARSLKRVSRNAQPD